MSIAEEWRELSPYLDEALTLPEAEREIWLASLCGRDRKLGERVRRLLLQQQAADQEAFLVSNAEARSSRSLAGQTIGVYTLISEIGHGGMSTVWLAERNDGRFLRRVAVKFLNISLAGTAGERRFEREGRILGRLEHPCIAELLDAGVSSAGQPYLVLDYIEGRHIDAYADEHRLNTDARIRLFLDVLAAVTHAHRNLIVHRDIKPSNVLVNQAGQVKLLDFGISKLLTDEEDRSGFASRPAMTPAYAAPEQLKNGAITVATDLYALGVLLYILLTGQHPAGAGPHSPADLVKSIVEEQPKHASVIVAGREGNVECFAAHAANRSTTPQKLQRQLQGDLDTILQKALRKDPEERYPSAAAFADDLQRYLRNEPIYAQRDKLIYRAKKFVRRNRMAVALATLGAVVVLASLIDALLQARTARLQRDLALRQIWRAEVVNEFDSFLLSDAAPAGKPLSVRELLRRAESIVARQHGGDAANEVELMVSIGHQYLLQDEAQSARRLLEQAYERSRKLSDVSARARAACGLAPALARNEELGRAESLFQEGLHTLPEAPQFVLERMECLQSGSEVAEQRGNIREAIMRAEAAQQALRRSPFNKGVLELGIWTDLAKMYSAAGRDADALAAFEKANLLLASLGRDETGTAALFYNDWALELDQLGRPLAAEPLYRRAIEISRNNQTSDGVSPLILVNYARVLRELDRLMEATSYSEQAYDKAARAGHQLALNQALLERARIYNATNQPGRAAAMLAEVEPFLVRDLPPNHYAFAGLANVKAEVQRRNGDLQGALTLADQAVAVTEAAIKGGGEGAFYLPSVLIYRSSVALEAGHYDRAQSDAERAVDKLQQASPDAPSSRTGKAYLLLGRALQAQNKTTQAQRAFGDALKHLKATLGPEHPETRSARELLAAAMNDPNLH
jgi:eukaryotic-like serine/threonine-protein kinase